MLLLLTSSPWPLTKPLWDDPNVEMYIGEDDSRTGDEEQKRGKEGEN